MARVFIGIGSNLGDRRAIIDMTRESIGRIPKTELVGWSKIYETKPVGPVVQDDFLNGVAELDTRLEPTELWRELAAIERKAGRPPVHQRIKWGPRPLDLDILLYDDWVISLDDLVIPHPMMHERWFVLRPLADLDANAVHPLLEMTVGELLVYVEQNAGSESVQGE